MLAISIPAFLYADRWGRRASVITGGILLSATMFIIGSLYATNSVHAHSGAGRWVVIVLIFAFALSYVATWGVVGKIYASEIQPARTRAAANSAAQGVSLSFQRLGKRSLTVRISSPTGS
jgi:MFS family permease